MESLIMNHHKDHGTVHKSGDISIGFCNSKDFRSKWGGGERHFSELSQLLASRNVHASFLADILPDRGRTSCYESVGIRAPDRSKPKLLSYVKKLSRKMTDFVETFKLDILHVCDEF